MTPEVNKSSNFRMTLKVMTKNLVDLSVHVLISWQRENMMVGMFQKAGRYCLPYKFKQFLVF